MKAFCPSFSPSLWTSYASARSNFSHPKGESVSSDCRLMGIKLSVRSTSGPFRNHEPPRRIAQPLRHLSSHEFLPLLATAQKRPKNVVPFPPGPQKMPPGGAARRSRRRGWRCRRHRRCCTPRPGQPWPDAPNSRPQTSKLTSRTSKVPHLPFCQTKPAFEQTQQTPKPTRNRTNPEQALTYSKLQTPQSELSTQSSRLETQNSRLATPNSRLETRDLKLGTVALSSEL